MPHQHRNRVFLPGVFFLFGFRRFRFHTNQGMDDGFESAPRASRPAPQPAPQPARQSAPVTSNTPFDQLEGDDVPF